MEHKLMSGNFCDQVRFEPNSWIHWDAIRALRNLEEVQNGFLTEASITWEEQNDYMTKHGKNFFVAMYNTHVIGYVGVVEDDIRFCVDPSYQGKGVGTFLLERVEEFFPNAKGRVKKSNFASISCFNKSGVPYVLIDD
jgi:GNAT superfamily N-acetyltransferase